MRSVSVAVKTDVNLPQRGMEWEWRARYAGHHFTAPIGTGREAKCGRLNAIFEFAVQVRRQMQEGLLTGERAPLRQGDEVTQARPALSGGTTSWGDAAIGGK